MLTRSANSAAVTAFASNGSPGTFGAHYAFPAGVQLPSGTRYLLARKGSSHASSDGVPVSKTSTDGVTWSSESTIAALTISGEDYRAGTLRLLSTGKLGFAFFTSRYNQFPSDIYKDAYRAYYSEGTLSGDTVTWRTPTRITGLSGLEDENNALEDFIELPNGELLFVTCGIDESPQAQFFNCFSFRGNAAGTSFGSVLTMALGTQVGRNAVEPSVTLLPDGRAFAQFHFEQSQDGSVPDAHAYQQYSTDSTITAWTTPTYVQVAWNRYGILAHPDGDVIFAYGPTNSYQVFKQSTDSGATYGTAIAITPNPATYYGDTWVTPFVIGSQGVSPNLAFVYGLEASGQTAGQVYYREFTRGATQVPTAAGYGNTVSSGYGDAEAFTPPPASLTIDPASGSWEQIDTSIIVRVTADGPASVPAVVTSTHGGLVRFRGTDASLFEVSLDGTTWASTVDVPVGETDVFLRVTPDTPGTTLSAEIGVPV